MERRKLKIALSLAVLIPCVLYIAGIIAQFMININAWKAAGSDYSASPGLPSLELADVFRSIFHFPEGLIAIGMVVVGIVLICIFGLRIGWGQNGVTDADRNLTVSNSGSYGTASFMSPKEASDCFDVTSAKKTEQDILGMLPDGQILTLPKNTRLNSNLAVCGSSGTGKSRSISRNLVLQAVKRGESLVLTDPKSELYESMSEYLRDNGYTVKVFNLIEMDHSDSWNSLNEVGSSELMAQTFADIVLQNTSGDSKDAFWYNAELNLLKALVLYVALEMPPEQRNLATVYDLLYTQTEKGLSDIMASISHEHVNQYTGELLPPSPAAAPYAIFKQSSDTVRTSVIIGLGVTIKKSGNYEVQHGQTMSYDFSGIANTSNVALNHFFWHDRIPTDATRALSISTGTYNARLYYKVTFKTNLNDYRTLASNLLTSNNYSLSLNAATLRLVQGEYVTDVRFEFGTVPSGFSSVMKPTMRVQVLGTMSNGYQIINRADVGGQYLNEWQTAKTTWVTTVRRFNTTPLPKTGY